jgi:hypothetical protein
MPMPYGDATTVSFVLGMIHTDSVNLETDPHGLLVISQLPAEPALKPAGQPSVGQRKIKDRVPYVPFT